MIEICRTIGQALIIAHVWAVTILTWYWVGLFEAGGVLTLLFGVYLWVLSSQLEQNNDRTK